MSDEERLKLDKISAIASQYLKNPTSCDRSTSRHADLVHTTQRVGLHQIGEERREDAVKRLDGRERRTSRHA